MQVNLSDITLDYCTYGNAKNPPLLLIMGLATQRTAWPQVWLDQFVMRGFYVITFDNRDAGLSSRFDHIQSVTPLRAIIGRSFGRKPKLAYELKDMAQDAIALLAHLQIQRAHVLGVSMGGMIAQWVALLRPELVSGLTLMMSSSGYPWLTPPDLAVLRFMSARPMPNPSQDPKSTADDAVDYLIGLFDLIGSPGFPVPRAQRLLWAQAQVARASAGSGALRQFNAIVADDQRWQRLGELKLPVSIIHGQADRLIPIAHGIDLAKRISGARFEAVPGLGHDLPPDLAAMVAEYLPT
jgi:pimeloyl-ACP methyl ester carboxylesterase